MNADLMPINIMLKQEEMIYPHYRILFNRKDEMQPCTDKMEEV